MKTPSPTSASAVTATASRRPNIRPPGFENSADGFAAFQASRECSSPLVINEAMVYNEWYRSDDGGLYDWVELKTSPRRSCGSATITSPTTERIAPCTACPTKRSPPAESTSSTVPAAATRPEAMRPFALNAQSDSLYLSSADGRLCDYTPLRGIKYGGATGGCPVKTAFFYFASATIGADNAGGARCIAAEPVPSIEPGVYDGVEGMSLELSAGGTIYYTIDGHTQRVLAGILRAHPTRRDDGSPRDKRRGWQAHERLRRPELYCQRRAHLPVASLVADPDDLFGSSWRHIQQSLCCARSAWGPSRYLMARTASVSTAA